MILYDHVLKIFIVRQGTRVHTESYHVYDCTKSHTTQWRINNVNKRFLKSGQRNSLLWNRLQTELSAESDGLMLEWTNATICAFENKNHKTSLESRFGVNKLATGKTKQRGVRGFSRELCAQEMWVTVLLHVIEKQQALVQTWYERNTSSHKLKQKDLRDTNDDDDLTRTRRDMLQGQGYR